MKPENQPRQIVQISATQTVFGDSDDISSDLEVCALANDGSLWLGQRRVAAKGGFCWTELPTLPQPKTEKAKMKAAILGINYGAEPQTLEKL